MIPTKDGGFIIVGFMINNLTSLNDISAIKFDSTATIEWVGLYGLTFADIAGGIIESQDGGYVLTGYTTSYGDATKQAIFVMKISSSGSYLWSKIIGSLSGHSQGA